MTAFESSTDPSHAANQRFTRTAVLSAGLALIASVLTVFALIFAGLRVDKVVTDDDAKHCISTGGTTLVGGLLLTAQCVRRFPDGGKPCADSKECRGGCYIDFDADCGKERRCYPEGPPMPGVAAKGVCKRDDFWFGEVARIENGIVVESYVAD